MAEIFGDDDSETLNGTEEDDQIRSRDGDDTYVYKTGDPNFVWDGGGEDTIDASASYSGVVIYLEPGYQGYNRLSGKSERITSAGQITVNFGT